jgi:hypothetical protein
MMSDRLIEELIVEKAQTFIGQREKPGNMGFKVKWFDKLMRSVGFRDTHAWCVYFTELVWREAYKDNDERKLESIKALFTGGAVRTFRRFKKDPHYTVTDTPTTGGLLFWQLYKNGKATSMGHAAICSRSSGSHLIHSIDGNTNSKGGREGVEVAAKTRTNNMGEKHGLVYLGCVLAPGIEGT